MAELAAELDSTRDKLAEVAMMMMMMVIFMMMMKMIFILMVIFYDEDDHGIYFACKEINLTFCLRALII